MIPVPNEFTETQFVNELESLNAQTFNPLQLAYLNNSRAEIARQILSAPGTYKEYNHYVERVSYLKGQLDFINTLIEQHQVAIQSLNQLNSQEN